MRKRRSSGEAGTDSVEVHGLVSVDLHGHHAWASMGMVTLMPLPLAAAAKI